MEKKLKGSLFRDQSLVQDLLDYSRVSTRRKEFVPMKCEDPVDRLGGIFRLLSRGVMR